MINGVTFPPSFIRLSEHLIHFPLIRGGEEDLVFEHAFVFSAVRGVVPAVFRFLCSC